MCSSHSTVLMRKVDKSFINALCVHQQALVEKKRELHSPSVHATAALHLFHCFPPGSNYGYRVEEKSIIHKNTVRDSDAFALYSNSINSFQVWKKYFLPPDEEGHSLSYSGPSTHRQIQTHFIRAPS